jgi:6-phosphogluconolactonase
MHLANRSTITLSILGLGACAGSDLVAPFNTSRSFGAGSGNSPGVVYTESNSPDGNAVLAFARASDGRLGSPRTYATGGLGTGQSLGSQGAVVLSGDDRYLFVVNAGSDEVSVFRATPHALELTATVPSGGDQPTSITVHRDLVYVLNAGGAGNISGFRLMRDGSLSPIAGSTRPLSSAAAAPAQVEFSPDGDVLVVTERNTNTISTYRVGREGLASGPIVNVSAGATPFGFAFDNRSRLLVSEAFGGAPDASATSSYILHDDGTLAIVSASVRTTETAACWVVVTNSGRYAYVTNTGSGTVSGYAVAPDGSLTLLDADGRTGVTGPGSSPIDAAFDAASRFLYILNDGTNSLSVFAVNADGSLDPLPGVSGLPPAAAGLAAR